MIIDKFVKAKILNQINKYDLKSEIEDIEKWMDGLNKKQVNNFLSINTEKIRDLGEIAGYPFHKAHLQMWGPIDKEIGIKGMLVDYDFLNNENINKYLKIINNTNSNLKALCMCQILSYRDLSKIYKKSEYIDAIDSAKADNLAVVLTRALVLQKSYDISDDDIKKIFIITKKCKDDAASIDHEIIRAETIFRINESSINNNYIKKYREHAIDAVFVSGEPDILSDICFNKKSQKSLYHEENLYLASHVKNGLAAMAINVISDYASTHRYYLYEVKKLFDAKSDIMIDCLYSLMQNEEAVKSPNYVEELHIISQTNSDEETVKVAQKVLSKYNGHIMHA